VKCLIDNEIKKMVKDFIEWWSERDSKTHYRSLNPYITRFERGKSTYTPILIKEARNLYTSLLNGI